MAWLYEIYLKLFARPTETETAPDAAAGYKSVLSFDAERFGELVQNADVKARLLANTERSVERGTFGSPTFFVGKEMFFGKEQLREVEELVLSK